MKTIFQNTTKVYFIFEFHLTIHKKKYKMYPYSCVIKKMSRYNKKFIFLLQGNKNCSQCRFSHTKSHLKLSTISKFIFPFSEETLKYSIFPNMSSSHLHQKAPSVDDKKMYPKWLIENFIIVCHFLFFHCNCIPEFLRFSFFYIWVLLPSFFRSMSRFLIRKKYIHQMKYKKNIRRSYFVRT